MQGKRKLPLYTNWKSLSRKASPVLQGRSTRVHCWHHLHYLVFWKEQKISSESTVSAKNTLFKLSSILTWPPFSVLILLSRVQACLQPSFSPSSDDKAEGSPAWDLSAQPFLPTWHASLPPSGKPAQRKVRPLMGFCKVNRAVIHSSWVKMGRFTSCKTCGTTPPRKHRNENPSKALFHLFCVEDAPFRPASFGKIWISKHNVIVSIFKMSTQLSF